MERWSLRGLLEWSGTEDGCGPLTSMRMRRSYTEMNPATTERCFANGFESIVL